MKITCGSFTCADGRCVDISKRCNSINDSNDWSDENKELFLILFSTSFFLISSAFILYCLHKELLKIAIQIMCVECNILRLLCVVRKKQLLNHTQIVRFSQETLKIKELRISNLYIDRYFTISNILIRSFYYNIFLYGIIFLVHKSNFSLFQYNTHFLRLQ